MSRHIKPLRFAIAVLMLLFAGVRPAIAQDNYSSSYQQFYDELSPYGEWINDPQNGYVWVPDAGNDFRPYYSNGYWTNTEYGNTWVSNYAWGWAPFHYGRWTYSNYYGWIWIPGNEWGPAWVSWRSGGGCFGWAPLGPGVSISLSFGNSYYVPDYWWTFAPQQYILNPGFHRHTYRPRYNSNYIRQTTIINNTYVYNNRTYIAGPRRTELERATGRPVKVVSIRNSNRPDRAQLRGNSLSVYRPVITEARPRTTERPRRFRTVEQPLINTQRETAAPGVRNLTRQSAQQRELRNDRPALQETEVQRPRIERQPDAPARIDRMDRQPARAADIQQQQRIRSDWDSRAPAAQPQPRIERAPTNRGMDMPRVQQAQPMPQRVERPMIERRQPPIQQIERPRAMPQQAPAAQPMRSAQPQMNNRAEERFQRR